MHVPVPLVDVPEEGLGGVVDSKQPKQPMTVREFREPSVLEPLRDANELVFGERVPLRQPMEEVTVNVGSRMSLRDLEHRLELRIGRRSDTIEMNPERGDGVVFDAAVSARCTELGRLSPE